MALPKKQLKERLVNAGVSEENMDELIKWILDGHTTSLDAVKEQLDEANNKVSEYEKTVTSKTTDFEKLTAERDKYKTDLETLQKTAGDAAKVQADFDAYKNEVETKATNARKTAAVRSALKTAGVKRDELVDLLIGKIDLSTVELDGDSLKDADSLTNPLKESYSSLFSTTRQEGTPPATPPTGGNGGTTKEEILKIKDHAERQKAIAENIELFS